MIPGLKDYLQQLCKQGCAGLELHAALLQQLEDLATAAQRPDGTATLGRFMEAMGEVESLSVLCARDKQ